MRENNYRCNDNMRTSFTIEGDEMSRNIDVCGTNGFSLASPSSSFSGL